MGTHAELTTFVDTLSMRILVEVQTSLGSSTGCTTKLERIENPLKQQTTFDNVHEKRQSFEQILVQFYFSSLMSNAINVDVICMFLAFGLLPSQLPGLRRTFPPAASVFCKDFTSSQSDVVSACDVTEHLQALLSFRCFAHHFP